MCYPTPCTTTPAAGIRAAAVCPPPPRPAAVQEVVEIDMAEEQRRPFPYFPDKLPSLSSTSGSSTAATTLTPKKRQQRNRSPSSSTFDISSLLDSLDDVTNKRPSLQPRPRPVHYSSSTGHCQLIQLVNARVVNISTTATSSPASFVYPAAATGATGTTSTPNPQIKTSNDNGIGGSIPGQEIKRRRASLLGECFNRPPMPRAA